MRFFLCDNNQIFIPLNDDENDKHYFQNLPNERFLGRMLTTQPQNHVKIFAATQFCRPHSVKFFAVNEPL